jgi:hypothetical protein
MCGSQGAGEWVRGGKAVGKRGAQPRVSGPGTGTGSKGASKGPCRGGVVGGSGGYCGGRGFFIEV